MRLIVVAHNIRSTYNVGSIMRTCEGFGVEKIIFSGYTPYPGKGLPHEGEKLAREIAKTALGAESLVAFSFSPDILATFQELRDDGWKIVILEQSAGAIMLPDLTREKAGEKVVLLLGEEVEGVPTELFDEADFLLEIPMHGKKESFNVSVATGVAIYKLMEELK
jgi:tRNA G18 (ribose-2'-O)-methylase SpoU